LLAAGIVLPPTQNLHSVRVAITQSWDDAVQVAAENLPYVAFGPTDAEAEKNLRDLCSILGKHCPDDVYNVAKAIGAWMN
jgi:hypothetical protein